MSYQINKILVPIDLTESSLNALETAISLAKKHGSLLYILNVEEPNFVIFSDEPDLLSTSYKKNSNDILEALINSITHVHALQPKLITNDGNVTEQIIKVCFSEQCDLIVMGSYGASGFREGFIGSNTYAVMKYAICPVLSVPVKKNYLSFKKVVFPIRPVSGALNKYDVVCHFLANNSVIDVLGLSYKRRENETTILNKIVEEVKEKLQSDKVSVTTVWGTGDTVSEDVINYSNQINPDMVVITPILDITTKNGFVGPHAQKIIHTCKSAVLSIKTIGVPAYA
jgi:nucleotide-binding universal stress UspA family protein